MLHTVEGLVDGVEELGQLIRIGARGGGFELGPSLDQLAVQARMIVL
jgi:hypothetical protein